MSDRAQKLEQAVDLVNQVMNSLDGNKDGLDVAIDNLDYAGELIRAAIIDIEESE